MRIWSVLQTLKVHQEMLDQADEKTESVIQEYTTANQRINHLAKEVSCVV